ncbi:hypothetical protein EEDFHM_02268 [Methylorubrum populi]
MTERLQRLVEDHDALAALRGERLSEVIDRAANEIDHEWLHVAADDAFSLKHAAHYLISGIEWIMAVLGGEGRRFLRTYATPTLLEIDLPLSLVVPRSRYAFARMLMREWMRLTCNRTAWTAPIDFGFRLATDIPPGCIVGHRHPQELRDPLQNGRPYRPEVTSCLHCVTMPTPNAQQETDADAEGRVGG